MPVTGAMRVWAAGQLILAGDVVLGPAAALAGGWVTPQDLAVPAPILVAALALILIPADLALNAATVRGRWWFWVAASLPAALWVPAMPFVSLAAGPPLGSVAGLTLAGAGLGGAVAALVGGSLAALETRRSRS